MATPPARTELADTYPNPSNGTFRTGIGKLFDYVTGLLGSSGNAADARAALGLVIGTDVVPKDGGLGTPTSGVLTNCTGTATGLTAGTATTATTATTVTGSAVVSTDIGYATGVGGAVTQLTDKNTTVTINKKCGDITLASDSIAAGGTREFMVMNNKVTVDSIVLVAVKEYVGFNRSSYTVEASGGVYIYPDHSFHISIRNNSSGALNDQFVIKFIIVNSPAN
jgi:hypothetical protein